MRRLAALLLVACSAPPPATVERNDSGAAVFSVALSAPDVQPGAEGLHCIDVPGPPVDTYVGGWTVRRTGVHHINAHVRTGGTPFATWSPCGDVFGSSDLILVAASDVTERIPDGAAFLVPGRSSLVFDVHYINTGAEPVRESVEIEFLPATEHDTIVHAMNLQQAGDLNLAPGTTKTVTFSAAPQIPIRVVSIMGHMHAHGVAETVSVGGSEVYRTESWTDPEIAHPAALTVGPSAPLVWSCTIANDTATPIQWGTTVQHAEMCQVFGLVTQNHWTATGKAIP